MKADGFHTNFDVLHEFLIDGAELTEKGFPKLKGGSEMPSPSFCVDFKNSFRLVKDVRKYNINFYIDDQCFERVWNTPMRYLDHLKCFGTICGPDFSIDTRMPLIMQMWQKYKGMALTYHWQSMGLKVIPNVSILEPGMTWQYEGIPKQSVVCACTNGRVHNQMARDEFKEAYAEMEEILKPSAVVLYGRLPRDGFEPKMPIINCKTANQILSERMKDGKPYNKIDSFRTQGDAAV